MSQAPSVRVLIADGHRMFRAALRELLESDAEFDVVGEAGDGDEAVEMTQRFSPDVLMLELAMPRVPGLEAMRQLNSMTHSSRIIVLTAQIENDEVAEALRVGACGIIMKNSSILQLFQGIRTVMAGDYWVGAKRVSDPVAVLQAPQAAPIPRREERPTRRAGAFGLTPRELQVVRGVVAGCSNRALAERLAISPDTAKHHLSNIFDKLGVSNRLELALFASHHRVLDDEAVAEDADMRSTRTRAV